MRPFEYTEVTLYLYIEPVYKGTFAKLISFHAADSFEGWARYWSKWSKLNTWTFGQCGMCSYSVHYSLCFFYMLLYEYSVSIILFRYKDYLLMHPSSFELFQVRKLIERSIAISGSENKLPLVRVKVAISCIF